MTCILPEPGYTIVSLDLVSGEPTATAHYSKDIHYLYATVTGVGKAPFYKNNLLFIDDVYLMVMSVSPIGAARMRKAFYEDRFEGLTFVEAWLKDPEIIKKALKKERAVHKMLCLALGYGCGPAKMVKQCYENGFELSLEEARAFFKAYWALFSGIKRFADALEARFKRVGYLVNQFGYRLVPDKPFKAFNYYIQSTISGILHVFCWKLFTIAPWARMLTVIHDELMVEVPTERLAEFRQLSQQATDSLNADLKWIVPVRTGFMFGQSWFDVH